MLARFFRHDSCSKRLSIVEDRCATVEGQVRRLEADYLDLWDRVQRQVGRLVKRADREQAAREEPTTEGLDPISSRILNRRNHRAVRPVVPE